MSFHRRCKRHIRRAARRNRQCRRKCRRHPHPHPIRHTHHKHPKRCPRNRKHRQQCPHRHTPRTHRARCRRSRRLRLQCQILHIHRIRPHTNKSHRQWWLLRSCRQWHQRNRCKKSCHRCTRHKRPTSQCNHRCRRRCHPRRRQLDKNLHKHLLHLPGHKSRRCPLLLGCSCTLLPRCNRGFHFRRKCHRRRRRSRSCRRNPRSRQQDTCKNRRLNPHQHRSCKRLRLCNHSQRCCFLRTRQHRQRTRTFVPGRNPHPAGKFGN